MNRQEKTPLAYFASGVFSWLILTIGRYGLSIALLMIVLFAFQVLNTGQLTN